MTQLWMDPVELMSGYALVTDPIKEKDSFCRYIR
jgi:hypothetical protein